MYDIEVEHALCSVYNIDLMKTIKQNRSNILLHKNRNWKLWSRNLMSKLSAFLIHSNRAREIETKLTCMSDYLDPNVPMNDLPRRQSPSIVS